MPTIYRHRGTLYMWACIHFKFFCHFFQVCNSESPMFQVWRIALFCMVGHCGPLPNFPLRWARPNLLYMCLYFVSSDTPRSYTLVQETFIPWLMIPFMYWLHQPFILCSTCTMSNRPEKKYNCINVCRLIKEGQRGFSMQLLTAWQMASKFWSHVISI